jgi:hypothetical protein
LTQDLTEIPRLASNSKFFWLSLLKFNNPCILTWVFRPFLLNMTIDIVRFGEIYFFEYFGVALGIELGALFMLGSCSTTDTNIATSFIF